MQTKDQKQNVNWIALMHVKIDFGIFFVLLSKTKEFHYLYPTTYKIFK